VQNLLDEARGRESLCKVPKGIMEGDFTCPYLSTCSKRNLANSLLYCFGYPKGCRYYRENSRLNNPR
jgi:hypothetical protein